MAFLEQWLLPCYAPFRICRYRTNFTVDIDTLLPVSTSIFTRSFAVVLGLICTFLPKVRSTLVDWTQLLPEILSWLRGPMVFILAYYCLYRWTWYLQDLEIAPNEVSEVLADFFWFSDQRTLLQKVQSLSLCAVANRSLALWWFWSSGFFLAEHLSGYVDIGLVLLWI